MTGLPDFSRQRMLAGVCLWLATKLGWNVWGFRAAALLALWINPLLTGVVYLAGGWWINRGEQQGSDQAKSEPETHSRRRSPVIIDHKPTAWSVNPGQADVSPEPASDRQEDGREAIHAHSRKVEELLQRYRTLDERLDRQA